MPVSVAVSSPRGILKARAGSGTFLRISWDQAPLLSLEGGTSLGWRGRAMQGQALTEPGSQADPTSSWADITGIAITLVATAFLIKALAAYIWWTVYLVNA